MSRSFVHLHVRSHYSFLRGVSSPEALCHAAALAGMDTLALTDTNGLYGLMPFLEAAKRYKIRPVIGAVLNTGAQSMVVLVKSEKGLEALNELLTRRHMEPGYCIGADFPSCIGHLAVLSSDPEVLTVLRGKAECWVELTAWNSPRKTLALARDLDLSPVVTNAVHFTDSGGYLLHRLVRAIDLNCTFSTLPPSELVSPEQWLKPPKAMEDRFSYCPEAVANTMELVRECRTDWRSFRTVFPCYRDQEKDHFQLLADRCRQGIRWRYGRDEPGIETRLEEELELIREKGYVDYFLVVADLVARRPIHCGRGSAAASLVGYLLGITHVDPVQHRLVFGRFLNPQRKDYPDIDVDFPWDERDELLKELAASHGADRMAMVSNHIGFGARAALREVAKVYGIPADEIKAVTRHMGAWTHPARIDERVSRHPRFQGVSLDPPWPEIMQWAARLEGIPRHLGTHCGGVILAPDRVSRYAPVQRSAKGVRIIQWEKDQAEEGGLVKIDLLGNRSLAVIRDTLTAVERNTGMHLEYARLNPLEDQATVDLLARGNTMGVFYVESPAMRRLQQKTGRGDFEHLVIHSSIIRPAANRYIQDYVRRLHGEIYEPLHPALDSLLSETYGILVYQEDVIQTAMALAGWDWAESDGLRKVLSKKSRTRLEEYRRKFEQGCASKGVSQNVVEEVWGMFESFAGYSFCKPHSASYALVSFKSAFLKVHYPAEFMAAVMHNGGGYYTRFAYISEARRMGIRVLGPDINESGWAYEGRKDAIRVGFEQLRHMRREALEAILEERARNGPFSTLEEFVMRVELDPSDAGILVNSGALDSLGGLLTRPQVRWAVESWFRRSRGGPRFLKKSLFRQMIPALPEFSLQQRLEHELKTLGFVLSVHPIKLYALEESPACRLVLGMNMARHVGQRVCMLGWPVTRKEVLTRRAEPMEFVSFEDETGIFETVFFPEAFRRFCRYVDSERAVLLQGRVEKDFGAVSMTVEHVRRTQPRPLEMVFINGLIGDTADKRRANVITPSSELRRFGDKP